MLGLGIGNTSVRSGGGGSDLKMLAAADAYLTRIGAANATLEQVVIDAMKAIGRDVMATAGFLNSVTYLAWPESEAQGVVPFNPFTGNYLSPEDRMQNYNGAIYTAERGFEGNGVDSSFYIATYPSYWTVGNSSQRPVGFYMALTKVPTGTMNFGFQVSAAARFRISQAVGEVSLFASLNSSKINITGNPKSFLVQCTPYWLMDFANGVAKSPSYQGGDYVNRYDDVTFSTGYANGALATSNRGFPINGYTTGLWVDEFTPLINAFSNQAIAGISFFESLSDKSDKIIAEQMDAIQTGFGRIINQ